MIVIVPVMSTLTTMSASLSLSLVQLVPLQPRYRSHHEQSFRHHYCFHAFVIDAVVIAITIIATTLTIDVAVVVIVIQ